MEIKIIRHGPKEVVKAHIDGTEADLDQNLVHVINDYAKSLPFGKKDKVTIDTLALPRNYKTSEIIAGELQLNGVLVSGPYIEDRLGAFVGEEGKVCLMSSDLPRIWGDAEKNNQTIQGVTKEDKGMYAWAEYGLTLAENGISLQEIGFRIGDYLLNCTESIDDGKDASLIIGISNSGFIEPFVYNTLDMIRGKKTAVENFFNTSGAIEPLCGISMRYGKGDSILQTTFANGQELILEKDVLKDQRGWLKDNGIADKIYAQRIQEMK